MPTSPFESEILKAFINFKEHLSYGHVYRCLNQLCKTGVLLGALLPNLHFSLKVTLI